ncbi:sigma-54-dependent transcriptional regulator [Beijerinckia indica]|uniref:DNA-binding transcriptional regulator NtrC n=1 Tax=Beijerinckia indica subsp. indica (strain ATCC 9039 / DSM 1715 / NCIMB 8712) TaxID=395963 RepID=B2IBS8_BEII9|nr:sigma-54 dependent transcriptional regulator [Beijerinckia indica]ACB93800.1 two component, sigma54 specific, transcriptional regulator, Fis family [Beijerinckia indica subsp. indica ATCC 9039]
MSPRILIADDDPVQRRLLEAQVQRFGYVTETVDNGAAALARVKAQGQAQGQGHGHAPLDLLILDLAMPDIDGLGVLKTLRKEGYRVPAIVQTANGSIETVIAAMRAGAADFVVKPVGTERLQVSIKNALRADALEDEIRRMNRHAAGALSFKDLIAGSEAMERVIRLGERAAKSTIPILLEGESGVGKEVIARAIQGLSDRRGKPFITVNCGALPEPLVESILFGHEKGAFTGANERHVGKFVEANGGTLFLDEIGELPLETQVKLLRALQEGEVDPIGAKRPVKVDIRLISATNRNLIEQVKRGRFREDLYYRLNVFPIHVPALRARREDITELARTFATRFAAEEGKPLRGLTPETEALLCAYDWPGNVRQLENAVFRAVVLADGDELTVTEFPQIAAHVHGFDICVPPAPLPVALQPARETEFVPVELRDPHVLRLLDDEGEILPLERLEAEIIRFSLIHYRGQMSAMARKLGIGRSTLYRKLKEYGLQQGAEGDPLGLSDPMAGLLNRAGAAA